MGPERERGMSVHIVECDECGEFDGRHRSTAYKVVEGCSQRTLSQLFFERMTLFDHLRRVEAEIQALAFAQEAERLTAQSRCPHGKPFPDCDACDDV
jgi:hypothetical protein